jgi:hypothetical protein
MQNKANVWVTVDIPDPDNKALVLAASSPRSGMNVVGVSVVGRPATDNREAPITESDPYVSAAVRRSGAAQVAGMLQRAGRGRIPVFEGLIAPHTVVPHKVHIDELEQDLMRDRTVERLLAGGIAEAADLLASLEGGVHFVCGGPLSDVAYFLKDRRLKDKFCTLTAQLGNFSSGEVEGFAGGRKQFNAACDPVAAHEVLFQYPGAVYMVPTEITRNPRLAFRDPEDLLVALLTPGEQQGLSSEELLKRQIRSMDEGLYEIWNAYQRVFPVMMAPRGEQIYVHDVHPGIMMSYLLTEPYADNAWPPTEGAWWAGPYLVERIAVKAVPHTAGEEGRWGEIDIVPYVFGKSRRFVARCTMHMVFPRLASDMRRLLTALPSGVTRHDPY